jgi:sugar lactone lactonase YvrE
MGSVFEGKGATDMALTRLASHFGLLEAARWYPDFGLVFSDMTEGGVYSQPSPSDEPRVVFPHRKAVGGLVQHEDGGFILAGRNVAHKSIGSDSVTTVLLSTDDRELFFNDLTADGRGRVFVGSVGVEVAATSSREPGSLYCIDLDGVVTRLANDILMTNGLCADVSDRFLYHADSNRRAIFRYNIAGEMSAIEREIFADSSSYGGQPDGLAIAEDGSVWAAIAGSAVVVGWDAKGVVLDEIAVPHDLVTSVCFGGFDLRTMFILTGQNHEYPDPEGGCIYSMDSARAGLTSGIARVSIPEAQN